MASRRKSYIRKPTSSTNYSSGAFKYFGKEGGELGGQRYYGTGLVKKVRDDMLQSKTTAWGANQNVVKKEMVEYYETKRKSSKEEKGNPSGGDDAPGGNSIPCFSAKKKDRIMIDKVEAVPPMNFWMESPINVPTPDSKFLTHFPFMGDDHEKRNKKGKFSEKLVEMYDGKLHPDGEEEFPIEDLDLIDFIRVLMEVSKRYGEAIFSDAVTEVKGISKPIAADLRRICDHVERRNEMVYLSDKPSMKLFNLVCKTAYPEFLPDTLMKQYIMLAEKRNPEFDKKKVAPSDLDIGNDGEVYSKEDQMDSYRSLFCRLCYKYACLQHTLLMDKEEVSIMQKVAKLQRAEDKKFPKGPIRVDYECKDCWKKHASTSTSKADLTSVSSIISLSEWTAAEKTMFNCYYDSFKDFCVIATLLDSKTCREIKLYHQFCQQTSKADGNGKESGTETDDDRSSPESDFPSISGSSGYESPSPNYESTASEPVVVAEPHIQDLCTFVPCCHENGICDETCSCVLAKKFCEASCGCLKSCKNRSKGCVCLKTCDTKRCPCFIAMRECDPDLCKKCGAHEIDINKVTCKNVVVQRRLGKPLYIKKSRVSGYGAFAGVAIKKGEFISEYTAELISGDEADKRGHVYDERKHTYLFDLTENLVLDASRIGNNSRFMNSSKRPNCQPFKVTVRGELRVAIRATKHIEKDEELFINYHQVLRHKSTNKTNNSRKRSQKYVTE